MKISRIIFCFTLVLTCALFAFGQKNKPVAEDFTAVTLDGETVELSSLRGKVVVITFWSTRCPICVAEIPKMNQLVDSYRGKDVVFLGLTTDNSVKVQSFLKMKPFAVDIIPDSFGILLKYAERDREGNLNMGFPAYFVVNQSGEVELKANGWDKTNLLNTKINRLLMSSLAKVE